MIRVWRSVGLLVAVAPWCVVGFHAESAAGDAEGRSGMQANPVVVPAWRKPDAHGRACVSCHSPDGFEIAAYAFTDADILRRAAAHVREDEAKQIVEMIHGVRSRYHIVNLLNPMEDRPMQPGGTVLGGDSPMNRDASFAATLPAVVPLLFSRPIQSLALAKAARDQMMAVDLSRLKIGIPLNRLSEDGFHGNEHATIDDWIPDVPLTKELPLELQDAYLASPSDKNYEAIDATLAELTPRQATLAQSYSAAKRRALLYFQHRLRMAQLGKTEPLKLLKDNPMWEVGDFARLNTNVKLNAMGLPEDILAKKEVGPSSEEQLRQLRLGWFWLGWCMDPGLQKSSPFTETMRADYFTRDMWADGPYPMHLAFMITRKIASESFLPQSWNSAPPQHLDLDYSAFTNDGGIAGPEPRDPDHRRLFDTFVANSFRMNLLLQIDELSRTHLVFLRQALNQQIRRMKAVFTDPKDIALADRTLALIAKSKDAGRWRHGQA